MRFLIDQGLSRSVARLLREAGHEADHVGELGMARADDAEVIATATERRSIIVTLDSDFH